MQTAVARRVLWYCLGAQVLMVAIFELVVYYPPSAVMTNNQSYVDVLSAAPRLVFFGTLAMFSGDITVTLKISLWLKRVENVDFFDDATNFNPLIF